MSTKKQRTVKTPSLGLSLIPLLGLVLFLLGMKYGDRLEESILKGLNERKGGKTK